MSITILIADDHKIVRDGLRSLIAMQFGMEVIAEASEGRTAVKLCRKLNPSVVLLDLDMPDLNGIDTALQIPKEMPVVKIVILSMHSDRHLVASALRAGVSGYVLKDCAFEELAVAIRTVANNQSYLSPAITGHLINDYLEKLNGHHGTSDELLSIREREVLQLIAEGKPTKQIAELLNVSVKTVESHRHNITQKLNIHSIAGLTKYAVRARLTSLNN
ncbi:MAG: response regulator [Desulfobacterales bacterium]